MALKTGSGTIKVGVRLRPMIAREENEPLRWKVQGKRVSRFDPETNRLLNPMEFDHVFGEEVKNDDVFKTLIEPLVQNAVKGFNATILAYGQTSSGKTHTMIGSEDDPGIVPLTMRHIFNAIQNLDEERNFLLGVSFMEVYNEKVRDLLNVEKSDLKVYETTDGSIATDTSVEMVNQAEQMIHLMEQGNKNKSIGETQMNDRSSRSHTIFKITIESQCQGGDQDGVARVSQINLVDLAGSERASQTGTTGQRYKEGCAINKSLLQLGNVVQKLSEDKGEFIDYRSSKLTRILQPSLSGNANIVMICNVTPFSADQTANTLLFASRASTIKLDPHLNELMDDATLLKRHAKRIKELEKDIKDASVLKERNQNLEREVEKLKDMLVVSRLSTFQIEKQRALRRRTWGGPALQSASEGNDVHLLGSAGANPLWLPRDARLAVPGLEKKSSLPETVTLRNDDFDDSVCMSIDGEVPSFLIVPLKENTPSDTNTPSKLRSEIINLRQQLAEKAAATPVLRQTISRLERNLEEKEHESTGTPKSVLRSKIQQLEACTETELQPEVKPSTPVPKLRERIKTLEEELENEHSKNLELSKTQQTLQEVEAELQAKTEALQMKTKDFEQLLKDKATENLETPGTPVAALHDRIKVLQRRSSQLLGTPPAQLRKKINSLEEDCKQMEDELEELREFTTLEKQMIEEEKLKELHREMESLQHSVENYEQLCSDLRNQNTDLAVQNEGLSEKITELQNSILSLTKELEMNKAWNFKTNEQQLQWKKNLTQCQEQISEMKNKAQDWVDEKEILKTRYEAKIKELTASLQEAWGQDGGSASRSFDATDGKKQDGDVQALQEKITQLEEALKDSQSHTEEKGDTPEVLNMSCQTEHDMEMLGHQQEAIKELQGKLTEAEDQLAVLQQKSTLETGCQTEHDNERPCETQNVMAKLEDVLDEKNKLASEVEVLKSERTELQQSLHAKNLEYESIVAELEDAKHNSKVELDIWTEKVTKLESDLTIKDEESERLIADLQNEKMELSETVKTLVEKVALLETEMDSQEELKEKLFFINQENENLQTQLQYQQDSLNFNLIEMDRLKSELSQAKQSASQHTSPIIIKEEPKDPDEVSKQMDELERQRIESEETHCALMKRIEELQDLVACREGTIDELRQSQELLEKKLDEKAEVFEFQHDSMTVMPINEVEESLKKEISELKAQLEAKKINDLETARHDLSLVNHELEDKLSHTLNQLNEKGLLPKLASQITSPAPHIESYISEQLEVMQTKNEELEMANSALREQVEEIQRKNAEMSRAIQETSSTQDDVKTFVELLAKQVLEVSGQPAKNSKLSELHSELLSAFMTKSKQVCADLQKQINKHEENLVSYKHTIEEQNGKISALESANEDLLIAQEQAHQSTVEIDDFKKVVTSYEAKIESLETDLADYRKVVDELQEKLGGDQEDSMTTMNGKELTLALQLNETKDCLEMAVSEERQLRCKLTEKEEELSAALEQKIELSNKVANLENEVQGLRCIIDETMKIAENSKEQCSELKAELNSAKEKIVELEHTIDVTEKASEMDREKLQKAKEDLANCKSRLAEMEDLEIKTSEELMDKLAEIDTMAKREAELQSRVAEFEKLGDASSSELANLQEKLAQLGLVTEEVEALRSSLADMEEFKTKAAEVPVLLSKIQELEEEVSKVDKLNTEIATLEIHKERAAEVDELKSKISEFEKLHQIHEGEISSKSQELLDMQTKLHETEELKTKLEMELDQLRRSSLEMEELRLKSKESEANVVRISELESALEEAQKDIDARKVYAVNLEEELACAKAARSFLDRSANTTTDLQLTLDNRGMDQMLALESVNLNLQSNLQKTTEELTALISEKVALEEKVQLVEEELSETKEKATSLRNQMNMLSAKEIKSAELVSTLKSEINNLKDTMDKLQHDLDICTEALEKEQERTKAFVASNEEENQQKTFSLKSELENLQDRLADSEKTVLSLQNENDNLKQFCDKKSTDLSELQSKYTQLSEDQSKCWQNLEEARANLELAQEQKLGLEKSLDLYKSNFEQMRSAASNTEEKTKQQLEALQNEIIKINNDKYEVELQLQEKIEQISELESKITNTNTMLNRMSSDRDVLSIRLQEVKASLAEASQQRDELSEKCRETDSEYEELLVVYREVETKSKAFQTQTILLREEKNELAARLKKLENEVGSIGSANHSACLQKAKEAETAFQEKQLELKNTKRELSYVRGELLHLKFRINNDSNLLEDPIMLKDRIKEEEDKVAQLSREVKSLSAKLQEAEKVKTQSKNYCSKCLPKSFPMEAGCQAVAPTTNASVQAPPDNRSLFDSRNGYNSTSVVTEAARMYGMDKQIRDMQAKIEELTNDRKLFKEVLRKRLVTIRALEAQVSAKENMGQENKGLPLADKN